MTQPPPPPPPQQQRRVPAKNTPIILNEKINILLELNPDVSGNRILQEIWKDNPHKDVITQKYILESLDFVTRNRLLERNQKYEHK